MKSLPSCLFTDKQACITYTTAYTSHSPCMLVENFGTVGLGVRSLIPYLHKDKGMKDGVSDSILG